MPAKAHADWKGDLQTGSGDLVAGQSIKGHVTFKSRFEDGDDAKANCPVSKALASVPEITLEATLAP